MKRILVALLWIGFIVHAPFAHATSSHSFWRKVWAAMTGENLTPRDDWSKSIPTQAPIPKPPEVSSIQTLMSLQNPAEKISEDAPEVERSQKLAMYNHLKEFGVDGIWLTNGIGGDPWRALAVRIVRSGPEILLVVDFWSGGRVSRLMSESLEDVVDRASPYRIDLSEKGINTSRYGARTAPLTLAFLKLNERASSFFLYVNGAEVLHLTMLRKWHQLAEEERDDIATMNIGGVTMSQFRRGDYPFPASLEVCRRYLGEL